MVALKKIQARKVRHHDHLGQIFADGFGNVRRRDPHIGEILGGFRKEPEPVKPFSVLPEQFHKLRDDFIAYRKNPAAWIDTEVKARDYGDGEWIFVVKPLLKLLGSGAYSEVFEIDDKHVLKVVKRSDAGYERFVKVVSENPDNPHFPKILFDGEWDGKRVYILERLSDEPKETWAHRQLATIIERLARGSGNEFEAGNPYIRITIPQSLKDAAKAIKDCCDDLHSGNIMWRGDVLVITDPDT